VLRGKELAKIDDVARQLEPLFGQWGRARMALPLFLSRERGCVSAGAQSGSAGPALFCRLGMRH
jgi:hypothetical protein